MILTPQLRQRIEMLQMTSVELNELIEQEMVANPILEEVQPGEEEKEISDNILDQNSDGTDEGYLNGQDALETSPADTPMELETVFAREPGENGAEPVSGVESDGQEAASNEPTDAFEEIDFGREFQDYLDPGYRTQEVEYKDDAPSFEQFLSRSESLSEHLEWQLHLLDIAPQIEKAAINIIGNLDEDGRLAADIDDVAASSGCTPEIVDEARSVVMSLDPVGCGAFDVRECLLAQLETIGEADSLTARLVRDHLNDLQPHRLQHLSKATGEDVHVLDEQLTKIRTLDPYPGRRYSAEEATYVAPEVYIEKVDGEYVIYFTDEGSP
ncbi:MAG TPA: hypothetical protein VJ837_04060, partial [Candidatus Paceibacterota bacterium]|nr:hypothetical protein [Candidatus Paceibacterota bacterium]